MFLYTCLTLYTVFTPYPVQDYAVAERYARKHYEALLLHAQVN